MKNVILSILCMLILTVPWGIYHNYSNKTITEFKNIIDQQVIPFAEMGDWDNAEKNFNKIIKAWDKYKKISAYFINTDIVNDTDCRIRKILYLIKTHDPHNSIAEAADLKYRLDYLHNNETPVLDNLL